MNENRRSRENEETKLLLHPLALMDGIFSKKEEQTVLDELREEAKTMGGILIVLPHNSN
jgi:hypothetical protein